MRYVLDTKICVYVFKSRPPKVFERLRSVRRGEVAMSAVTYAELRAGLEIQVDQRRQDEHVLGQFIERVPVLPFGQDAAGQFGILRIAMRARNGNALDRLIAAAQAISVGAILVTNNEADFTDFPGLTVENWAAGV